MCILSIAYYLPYKSYMYNSMVLILLYSTAATPAGRSLYPIIYSSSNTCYHRGTNENTAQKLSKCNRSKRGPYIQRKTKNKVNNILHIHIHVYIHILLTIYHRSSEHLQTECSIRGVAKRYVKYTMVIATHNSTTMGEAFKREVAMISAYIIVCVQCSIVCR